MHHAEDQLALDEVAGTLSSDQLFDTIGATYAATRPADPRIAARIWAALGDARTVVNVGAGTGSYEPSDREVTAVEPSAVMRAQRPAGAAPCVPGVAGRLPFADQSFDAAMAVSTDQHWPDAIAGYREMRRVARRVVTFHFDISRLEGNFWLIRDYMPEHARLSARPYADRAGQRDRRPAEAGTHPVGLPRRATSPPTGGGRRRTWTSGSGARYRCGTASAGPSRSGRYATCAPISNQAGGPSATPNCSTWTRLTSAAGSFIA